jgi:hypothetical protein
MSKRIMIVGANDAKPLVEILKMKAINRLLLRK